MKLNIQFEKFNEKYVDEAVNLIISAYKEEKSVVPFLPQEKDLISQRPIKLRKVRGE
jgi:hypothetical protein